MRIFAPWKHKRCLPRVRYADPDAYYFERLGPDTGGGSGPVELIQCASGKRTVLAIDSNGTGCSSYSVMVSAIETDEAFAWVEVMREFDTTGVPSVSAK